MISPCSLALLLVVQITLEHQLYGPVHISASDDFDDQDSNPHSTDADAAAFTCTQLLVFLGDYLNGNAGLEPETLDVLLATLEPLSDVFVYTPIMETVQHLPFLTMYKQKCLELMVGTEAMDAFILDMDQILNSSISEVGQKIADSSPVGIFVRKNIAGFREFELDMLIQFSHMYESFCRGDALKESASSTLPTPRALQKELLRIMKSLPQLSKPYYLSYLNHLRSGELHTALFELRRFIDYSVVNAFNRIPLQYASLNLAAVHAGLGHHTEAMEYISDALRCARTNRDDVCLSYVLMWLDRITSQLGREATINKYGGMPSEEEILDTLARRTERLEQHHLRALSHLRNARWRLLNGKSPALVFHSIQIAASVVAHYPGLESLVSTVELCKAGVWEVYGSKRSSYMAIQQILLEDNTSFNPNDMSMAFSKCALMDASEGKFDDALATISKAKKRFPVVGAFEASRHWLFALGYILFDRALLRLDLPLATRTLATLSAHCVAISNGSRIMKICEARLAKRYGRREEAYRLFIEVTEPQIGTTAEASLDYIPSMLELADLLLEGGREGAIAALPITLKCLALADRYHMSFVRIMGLARLGHILVHLKYTRQALSLFTELMPNVLSQGTAGDRGYAHLVYAQALIATADMGPELNTPVQSDIQPSKSEHDLTAHAVKLSADVVCKGISRKSKSTHTTHHVSSFRKALSSALHALQEAEKCFLAIGSQFQLERCYYLLSLTYNKSGMITERDSACKKLRSLGRNRENTNGSSDEIYTWEFYMKT
ncbi:hypothetical protein BASA50_011218 [Batrachochytrium salamandrivorans]|uniref:Anaphase-promoting complex subunit 5 n=1 Tax=Batrachochytrium salamandrivorans TaxID=1357716 RepID=A0ABQ8EYZ4_9FUNG|nr:hypothetical protein BASA62_009758 [Batrachochytrium salamandrivorans]KAH6567510.1 hypothetical protein BASA60_009010 [Batrachochytrium salamandrivorans]KAH6579897.1 hypothetical protein BASA61_010006 [Batrachochytrium salamandrivorans]KAH6587614.1 hypothetical protein BASA50_011218 [Batrachochytrium salamandrivorans]KAH9255880.1 hypothetical protein BASA81_006054 [Batrachochytrium salamandrivorans]